MDVMSVRIGASMKGRMAALGDVNWAEVIRKAVQDRLEVEEELRTPIDKRRARRAARHADELRSSLKSGRYDSRKEIRKWRDQRK